MKTLSFEIKPVAPFRLDYTAWALRRRPHNVVDRWDGSTYRRVLMLGRSLVEVEITQKGSSEKPTLQVTATGMKLPPETKSNLARVLERMLGFRMDLRDFYQFASMQRELSALAERFRGMKPPRFPTLFEALTNGIACQQLSLHVGIQLLNRLAENYGASLPAHTERVYSFPLPGRVRREDLRSLQKLGFSRQKGLALNELAQRASAKGWNEKRLGALGDDALLEELYQLRGVGRWTGEYVLLRGLGRIHIFPGDDVGARNKLQRLLNLRKPLDYEGIKGIRERWKPYGGFIYFHLLLDSLVADGHLPG